MGHETTVVDFASPEAVAAAIKKVNQTPGLRIEPGINALWTIHKAGQIRRKDLEKQYGAFDLHFGWFCRRVAEELGANDPDALALVDYSTDDEGYQVLSLKASIAAALPPHRGR
jgi:hypothetical protein